MDSFLILQETLRKFKSLDSVPDELQAVIRKLEKATQATTELPESQKQRRTKLLLQAAAYIAAHLPSFSPKEENPQDTSHPQTDPEEFLRLMELEAEAIQLLQLQKQP